MARPGYLVPPLLLGLALLAAACGTAPEPCASGSASEGASAECRDHPARIAAGAAGARLLPSTTDELPSFDPATYDELIAQLDGTPVVVNIWASWCGPCREEAPLLAESARAYGDRVQFVGVDIQDERGAASEFIREFGWTYPSVFDASGEIRDHLGFAGQPVTLFYGREGEVVTTWSGPIDGATLRENLDRLTA